MTIAPPKTRAECYTQILEKGRELQELCAHMAHFHNTETSLKDTALARGWLAQSELMKRACFMWTEMAKGTWQ